VAGSGLWFAEQAWVGHVATDVLIEVAGGKIKSVTEDANPPDGAVRLSGFTFPGLANVHSHAFQESLRGRTEAGGADFWEWRRQMFHAAEGWDRATYTDYARSVFREMLHAGITAVGEFHYLHRYGNDLGEALIDAARAEGIRITLLDACYLRGGLDGRPLDGVQRSFSDGDADRWVTRVEELQQCEGVVIGAAIHSVRAVDPLSMRVVASWARRRGAPLHIHLAEQPAEVDECIEFEGCTPAELLEREEILGPELTAIHAIHVSEPDVRLLGSHRVRICASPTTERDLGDRVGPVRSLAEAGSPLCLGSDSNSVIDILEEARALELDQRRATGRRVIHSPEALLEAATAGGMRSLGWDAGELKPGMLADFVTVAPPRTDWRGLGVGFLIFCCSARDVTHVVVGGRTLVG
jgi:formiminoglutamate deiminase